MKRLIFIVGFVAWFLVGCYDDKGNYDYHDFNEVTIGNRGFDTAYLLTSYVDTLRISPELEFKLEENKHLTYEWVARSNAVGFVEYPISNDRNLVYPMSLSAGEYTLFFKVKDTLNTMEYSMPRLRIADHHRFSSTRFINQRLGYPW